MSKATGLLATCAALACALGSRSARAEPLVPMTPDEHVEPAERPPPEPYVSPGRQGGGHSPLFVAGVITLIGGSVQIPVGIGVFVAATSAASCEEDALLTDSRRTRPASPFFGGCGSNNGGAVAVGVALLATGVVGALTGSILMVAAPRARASASNGAVVALPDVRLGLHGGALRWWF